MATNNSTLPGAHCGVYYHPFQTFAASMDLTVIGIVNFIFFFVGFTVNALVLFVFLRSNLLRCKACFFLMAVLSAVDLSVIAVVHPLSVVYVVGNLLETSVCTYSKLYNSARHLLCSLSSYILLAISVERYIAVLHPFLYQRTMSTHTLVAMCFFLTVVIVVEWFLSMFVAAAKGVIIIIQLGVFFLVTFFTYGNIFLVARRSLMKDIQASANLSPSERITRCNEQKSRMRDFKLSSVYVLLTVSFVFCYLPTILAYGLQFVEMDTQRSSFALFLHFREWARTFVTLNSTFNCFIFFWKNSVLRKEKNKILKRLRQ